MLDTYTGTLLDWERQMRDPTLRQRGHSTETRQRLSENNLRTESNVWSQVPEWARYFDILTDRSSVVMWLRHIKAICKVWQGEIWTALVHSPLAYMSVRPMNKKCFGCPIHLHWLSVCFAVSLPPGCRCSLPAPRSLGGNRRLHAYREGKTSTKTVFHPELTPRLIQCETNLEFVVNEGSTLIWMATQKVFF
jgi:hypothetical protein